MYICFYTCMYLKSVLPKLYSTLLILVLKHFG